MKLHTTEITAQRIKSFQNNPPRSPSFDFSNPNELEARYQVFCQEARSQLDAQSKPNLKHSTTFRNDKDEELKSMVRGAFKQLSEEKKRGILNPVVKTCGNLLIASVFEGLVLRAVEECTRGGGNALKMNELDGGLSEKLMKSFGIDAFQLRSFRSYKEKRGYLIGVMSQTIDKLLKNWKEKIEIREKNSEFDDSKGEKANEALDLGFSFLQLKTKYEALRKKLTATVVQKLNDYENQLKIIATLKMRQEKRCSLQPIHHDELKVNFTNVSKPNYLSKFSTPNTSFPKNNSRASSASIRKKPYKQFNANFLAFNYSKNHEHRPSRNMSIVITSEILEESFRSNNKVAMFGTESTNKLFPTSPVNKRRANSTHLNEYLQENADKNIEISEKHLKSALVWGPSLEKEFQKGKEHAKSVFFDENKRNNWDFIAVRNLAQKLFTEEKKNLQRMEKMKRYGEGDYLTAEELKFLADSSELLNACVDKRYLQNACNIIDENNLHFIELNLAEKIIRKYEEMKNIVMDARLEYFQHRNHSTKGKIQEFSLRKDKEMLNRVMSEKGKRYKKMIGTIWEMIEVKNEEKQEKEDDEIIEEMILKNFNAKFKKNFSIADLLRKKEAKKQKEKMSKEVVRKPQYQNLISELNNPLVVKHKFHPSSKLHKIEPDDKKTKEYMHHLDNIEQEYKISIKCPGTIRVPRNFAKYYSGGPKVNQSNCLYDNHSGQCRPPTALEMKSIIHIQSRLRGLMARTRFKRLMENHKNKKFVEAQERIFSKHTHKLKQKEQDSSPSNNSFSPNSYYARKMHELSHNKPPISSMKSLSSEIDINPNSAREDRIKNRDPPKSLLLKHRKLLEAALNDNYFMVNNSGFIYYPSDVNIRDKQGNTALYYTALNANIEFSKFLLRSGAKVNMKCSGGDTPIHMAFKSNNLDIVMALIEAGGDLNVLNINSQTPLAFATRYMLEILDLTEGVATVNERNAMAVNGFDNNKLLFKVPMGDRDHLNPDLQFKFDALRKMTMKVREKGKIVEYGKEKN